MRRLRAPSPINTRRKKAGLLPPWPRRTGRAAASCPFPKDMAVGQSKAAASCGTPRVLGRRQQPHCVDPKTSAKKTPSRTRSRIGEGQSGGKPSHIKTASRPAGPVDPGHGGQRQLEGLRAAPRMARAATERYSW